AALAGGERRTAARAKAAIGAARLALDQGDPAAAAYFQESLAIHQEVGEQRGIAGLLHALGTIAGLHGDYAAAGEYLQESLAISREIGDRHGTAYALRGLGRATEARGDYPLALTYLRESLATSRATGGLKGIAESLEAFASLAAAEGVLQGEERGVSLERAARL